LPNRPRFIALVDRLRREHPDTTPADRDHAIASGWVQVDGVLVTNQRALVRSDASIRLATPHPPRGASKLTAALEAFEVHVLGCTCADIGASTGGFTTALLAHGAARVYAVDAGFGQLLGSLRQDSRVRNLERTNLGDLGTVLIPEPLDLVTMDLSYLPLARAVRQLDRLDLVPGAGLLALVKPMFELSLGAPPTDEAMQRVAVSRAAAAMTANGWNIRGSMRSPIIGSHGAVEYFLHARRGPGHGLKCAQPGPVA
jgi:23S rRNA (cytidine1920-2'-O)/16S rRNA (cytidine1409-2'-O)-methyltransferase